VRADAVHTVSDHLTVPIKIDRCFGCRTVCRWWLFVSGDNVEGIDYVKGSSDASLPIFIVGSIELLDGTVPSIVGFG
jgi:hypothetical protein